MKSFKHSLQAFCIVLSLFCATHSKAQFTSGNLTLLQVGDGASSLINTGNAILLKEFSPAGVLTYSMAVPSAGGNALVSSGSASSEGFLSLSGDKKYLVFAGYAKALPNATPLPGATASAVNRGIGLVGGTGLSSYSLVTSGSFFTGNNIRSAAAADKQNCWASGGGQGTDYFGTAATPVTVQNSKTNLRATAIFNGQLYCSSQVTTGIPGDVGIYAIGTGTPLNNGQVVTTIINTGAGSQPAQFYFNAAGTVCYVADQRNAAAGGIQKWVQSAGSWSLAYTLPTGTAPVGATGVVADFSGTYPMVYATTNESSHNRLIAITDAGAASTATTLASATTANTGFRGLAFSPCSTPVVSALSSTTTVCQNQAFTLDAPTVGSAPLSWFWSGPGIIANPNSQNPVVSAMASGQYTVTAANLCGAATATVFVATQPQPAVIAASLMVCAGHAATVTANGADSYVWNNGSSSNSLVVTPASTTHYTVTGTLLNGCSKTITTQVMPANAPAVTVNSATLCAGSSIVLLAGGANSFTWSNGVTANSISITPAVTTTYSVSGNLAGCAGISTNTANVLVLPAPVLSITGASVTCGGSAVTQTVSGASTYSWSNGATGNILSVMPLVTTLYTVTGMNANGCSSAITSTISVVSAPTLTVSSEPDYLCQFTPGATLSVTGAESYTWSSGQTTPVITIANPFSTTGYTVTGTLGQNCSATQSFVLTYNICEGFQKNKPEPEIELSPNPAGTFLFVQLKTKHLRTITIHNLSGQIMDTLTTTEPALILNIAGYPKGLYVVSVSSDTGHVYKKLLID